MQAFDPDTVVEAFERGRLSRRDLVTRLMALGAVASGVSAPALGGLLKQDADAAGGAVEPTFAARAVDHLALNVTNIPRSRDWYVRHLGLRVTRESRTSCFLNAGDDFIALFLSDTPGMHHYSFAIAQYNQQAAAERLRAAGLEPKLRGGRIYFDDPDGIEVQVSQEVRPRTSSATE